jgi:hypothetical protein
MQAQEPNSADVDPKMAQSHFRKTPHGPPEVSANPIADQAVTVRPKIANPIEPSNPTARNTETNSRGNADQLVAPIVSGPRFADALPILLANSGDLHLPSVSAGATDSDRLFATERQLGTPHSSTTDATAPSSVALDANGPDAQSSIIDPNKIAESTTSPNESASANSSHESPHEAATKVAAAADNQAENDTATSKAQVILGGLEKGELLASAQRALREHRLTLPPDDNAYVYFQALLARDPDNAVAKDGFVQIARTYQELARQKIEDDDLDTAKRLVNRGLKVMPNDRGLLAVTRELKGLR